MANGMILQVCGSQRHDGIYLVSPLLARAYLIDEYDDGDCDGCFDGYSQMLDARTVLI